MNKSFSRFFLVAVVTAAVFHSVGARALFAQEPSTQPATPAPDTGVRYASLQSPSIERELKYAVQLPPSYERETKRRYPVLYFLHGMNGNEREFERRGVAEAVAKMRSEGKVGDFIIVAPAGENSFYLNAKNGLRYEDAIIKDLIPHIEKTYRVVSGRDGRAIQGLSMGGYGALMLAFKHPEMFSSVTAHSSALFVELPNPSGTDRRAQFMSRLIGNMYGNPPDVDYFKANNPINLAESNAAAIKKSGLKVYFDVGEQDRYGFQPSNKTLNEQLTKAGVTHEYHVFPGGHGWEYMLSVADNSYTFLWKNFKGNEKAARASR